MQNSISAPLSTFNQPTIDQPTIDQQGPTIDQQGPTIDQQGPTKDQRSINERTINERSQCLALLGSLSWAKA